MVERLQKCVVEVALRSAPPLMRCVDGLEVWLACLFSRLGLELQTNPPQLCFPTLKRSLFRKAPTVSLPPIMPPAKGKKAAIVSDKTIEAPVDAGPATPQGSPSNQQLAITAAQKQALMDNLQLESK